MCKKIFKPFPDLADCYDNYIYNHMNGSQVPEFGLHNVITKLVMMYERILEYSELQLSVERDCLRITNS